MASQSSNLILFLPVSSTKGIGEYMRSTIIAEGLKIHNPHLDIHFAINKHAPYSDKCEFNTHLLNNSPTQETQAVNQLISKLKPQLVVFDASGRKSQVAHAKKMGAKVVFISQHKKKRAKGLSFSRLALFDKHWVAQPDFAIAPLSEFEKLKLKLLNKPSPSHVGAIFSAPSVQLQSALQTQYQVQENQYILFNAGSGGHNIESDLAADLYLSLAEKISSETELKCLVIMGSNYPNDIPSSKAVTVIPSLNNSKFINLLAGAQCAVLSGGGTLLQALALNIPTLTTPVSKDQPDRIANCTKHNLALSSETHLEKMHIRMSLLLNQKTQADLLERMQTHNLNNGLIEIIDDIDNLLNS